MLTSGEKQAVTTPFLTCQVKHQLTAIRTTIVMTRRARTISPTTEKQAGEDVENSKVYAVPLGTQLRQLLCSLGVPKIKHH